MKRTFKVFASANVLDWPALGYWEAILDGAEDDIEDSWSTYLADPENEVNKKYQICPEPSTQGDVFIFDESGYRNTTIVIDFNEWCQAEMDMACKSSSGEEYMQKYESFIEDLIDANGWTYEDVED